MLAVPLSLLVALAAQAPSGEIETKRVQFARGASSATVSGTIKGYSGKDYLVGARSGQKLTVRMTTKSSSAYFNIQPPGSDTALFVGSTSGNSYTGALEASGDYRIRVYLMRNAARRNATASYKLEISVK